MGDPIRNVTIVGGGTAGWLAAVLLRRVLDAHVDITLIESPNIPTVGVGEATVPNMPQTLKMLGIPDQEFFKTCNASFKLGVVFSNWNVDKNGDFISYINPFSSAPPLQGHDWAGYYRSYGAGQRDYVQSYSPMMDMVTACKGPRMLNLPKNDSRMAYAFHLDAVKFAGLLRDIGVKRGIRHILDDVEGVELNDAGYVAAVQLKERGRHAVELVVDCTGFRSLILGDALKEPFVSYSKYLGNDRAMAVQIPHPDPDKLEPATRSTALGAGWSWRVPLFNRIGTGYVFSSSHRTDDEARDEFLAHLGPAGKDAEPRIIPMRIGRARQAWVKNCVAIGLSGGFIEPLESTAIHMIDMGVRWLATHFPDKDYAEPLRKQYNKTVDGLYNEVRDFICLHYALNNRTDSQYWIDARESLEMPDRLAELLEIWKHRPPAPTDLETQYLFTTSTYSTVLFGKQVYETGFGVKRPQNSVHLDQAVWTQALDRTRQINTAEVKRKADHRTLLRQLRGEIEIAKSQPQQPFPAAIPQATVGLPKAKAPAAPLPRTAKELADEDAGLL
ncbi:MAG: tryptophan 7-halogenase [Paracoccaceae bacterium]|nr:tryptophan 7-halogenase [Paracoccaceae bacterium]